MLPLVWLGNRIRNRLRSTLIGRLLMPAWTSKPRTIRVVSATRLKESDFWMKSALGQSLQAWRTDPNVSVCVQFANAEGLPSIYNRQLKDPAVSADVLVFVHDDVWLSDPQWTDKLRLAVTRFDVVGVAGNTRRSAGQPAWLFRGVENGRFVWDHPHLSGGIDHGKGPKGEASVFGPTPAACELLDGVFIAVRTLPVRRSKVFFDDQFAFHFYDMDFCRNARSRGLGLGTWPIKLTHQSEGSFGNPAWSAMLKHYRAKWN